MPLKQTRLKRQQHSQEDLILEEQSSEASGRIELQQIVTSYNKRLKRKQESIQNKYHQLYSNKLHEIRDTTQAFIDEVEVETTAKIDQINKSLKEYTSHCNSLVEELARQLQEMKDEWQTMLQTMDDSEVERNAGGKKKKVRLE